MVRHPQYAGLMLGVVGALVQWPTLITLLMAPVLVFTYYRLARREERELERKFGEEYAAYRTRTPMLLPRRSAGTSKVSGRADASTEGEHHGG
jgi:protein-S-isoprenylcysteine O-methyltransferase Ste14